MGLFDSVQGALGGVKPSKDDRPPEGASADETEELDEESGNILLSLISQLRIGMDLSKVTLPTFVLEPRSMLERITDFLSHIDYLFGVGKIDDSEKRFVQIIRYYMSGWHIKPKGVKKPYNPVLGEWFHCTYKYPDGSQGFYLAEQVSHHPPISAYFYANPQNNIVVYGELKTKSKFLGNSAANQMGGQSRIVLLDRPEDNEYTVSMPTMYARGILFGKMVLELGDHSKVENKSNDLACDIEFKTKGYFTGTYNAVGGRVTHKGKAVGEVTGKWSDELDYKHTGSGEVEQLFSTKNADFVEKEVRPESEQEQFESRRLWAGVTAGIKEKNLEKATDSKTAIEEAQRKANREREEKGETWKPRFFTIKGEKYYPKLDVAPEPFRTEAIIKYFESIA